MKHAHLLYPNVLFDCKFAKSRLGRIIWKKTSTAIFSKTDTGRDAVNPMPGGISAALVGSVNFIASFRAALTMLTFYLTSSKLTKWCEERKDGDEDFKKGGQRDWVQVPNLDNHSLVPMQQ